MNFNVPSVVSLFIAFCGLIYLGIVIYKKMFGGFDEISKYFFCWLLILLVWVYFSYANFGVEGLFAVREWIRLFSLFIIYLLSLNLCRKKGYKYVLDFMLLSLIVPLVAGIYQIVNNEGIIIAGVHRVYGTMAHPNSFSLYCFLFIAVLWWKIQVSSMRKIWYFLFLMLIVMLINTYSNGGIIITCIFFVLVAYTESNKKNRIFFMLLPIIIIAVFISTENGQRRIQELRNTPEITEIVNSEVSSNSISWRLVNWKILYEIWRENPLIGYGLGSAEAIHPWYNSSPHNDYLRFLVETGILGLIGYLVFLSKILFSLIRYRKYLDDHKTKSLINISISLYIAFLIGSFAGNYITTTGFLFYFFALIASISGEAEKNMSLIKKNTLK